jgi:hypothetical protein
MEFEAPDETPRILDSARVDGGDGSVVYPETSNPVPKIPSGIATAVLDLPTFRGNFFMHQLQIKRLVD